MEQGLKTYENCSYIDRVAPTLSQFLQNLQELTGWSFSVLMAGQFLRRQKRSRHLVYTLGRTIWDTHLIRLIPPFALGLW